MPYSCHVCNAVDYDEEDGLFFCRECGTQSQEYIVQEAPVNTDISIRHEVRTSQREKESSSHKPKANLGRPWTVYEAYQFIILAQTDALISLGADEKLKDVVFTLWANYLSKLGVAFCEKEKLVPDIVMTLRVGRQRELHRGTLSNPLNRRKRPFREPPNAVDGTQANADDQSLTNEEEFYEEDMPADDALDNIVFINEDDILEDTDSSDEEKNRKTHAARIHKAKRSPKWMDIKKTIALCYIGLIFTNTEILPCDVVRWVYEGRIPYFSSTHLLPQDIILSAWDQALFCTSIFNTSNLIIEINKLLNYLGLDDMPRSDLKKLIHRFVKDMCLPDEFARYSTQLADKMTFRWHDITTGYAKQEILALAYIIMALKMAFVLDDTAEWELSEYSKQLQELVSPENLLFNWSEWQKFIMQKMFEEFNPVTEPTKDIQKVKLQHLDQLLQCYARTECDKKRLSTKFTLNHSQHKVHRYEPEFRELLRKPLDTALERLEQGSKSKEESESSNEHKRSRLAENFQHSTVSHIVNQSFFKEKTGELSPATEKQIENLTEQYMVPRTEVTHYRYQSTEDSLTPNRHNSYLWMLHLASQTAGYSSLELDKVVVEMLDSLASASCNNFGTIRKVGKGATVRLNMSVHEKTRLKSTT